MRLILFFAIQMFASVLGGCGSQREVEPKTPVPQPTAGPSPGGPIAFAEVQKLTTDYCLRCHTTSQFLKTEDAWRQSAAKTRLSNQSMPPPGTPEARNLTAADRQKLISF